MTIGNNNTSNQGTISWQKAILKYAQPDMGKSIWQIINSLIPYLLILFLMYRCLDISIWLTLALTIPAAGFLIRIFILFHDCGHGSFFKSKRLNETVGMILGLITYTPYYKWNNQHRTHHATTGNLDKRGIGDIWTMTKDEYQKSTPGQRFVYRAFRNPYLLLIIGPFWIFAYINRTTTKIMTKQEKNNVYFTNIILAVLVMVIGYFIGFKAFIILQLPVVLLSHCMGIWLFYIQHQFEHTTWDRSQEWDYQKAAVMGSSFLKLPLILKFFTGNIGFHHVHHLSSKIPNYNLEQCHQEFEMFKEVKPVVLKDVWKVFSLNLWDEVNQKLISFKQFNCQETV